MNFSIIIINFNTKELTRNCLNSILANCRVGDYEIIVVDNNSTDGSVEMLKSKYGGKIKLIVNQGNAGFGPANNQAARMVQGKYLFFLNSDTIIKKDILIPIKRMFNNKDRIGIIAPKLLLDNENEQEYAHGKFPTLFSIIYEKFKAPELVKSSIPFAVDWVSGAALIIRRSIFNKINGFDENFFMYFEDMDLCKRVKELGYQIIVYPKVFIVHLGGKSISKFAKRKIYYYQSQDYFYKKHFGNVRMEVMKLLRWPYKLLTYMINK